MNAYRFTAKISDSGTIQLPDNMALFDKEVEVIILPKYNPMQKKKKMTAAAFVEKWAGFLSDPDTDKVKFEYLSEKQQ